MLQYLLIIQTERKDRKIMKKFVGLIAVAMVCLLESGCGTPMRGSPSLTLLSHDLTARSPEIKVIGGQVEESDTMNWFAIFFMTGEFIPSHEAVLQRVLEKNKADLLVDSEMEISSYGIPYVYMQMNTTVRGRPAVFVKGGEK